MLEKPNLFEYATSELSQDALLCWLISWADKKYKAEDESLNKVAISFVKSMLQVYGVEVNSIKVRKQWKNIDVSVLIDERYFLVIEDKKGTSEHSDQLKRYKEIAEREYKSQKIDIKLVYFKMQEQGDYTNVDKAGFVLYSRNEMLKILDGYTGNNNILKDYQQNLQELDKKILSYKTLPIQDWSRNSWRGFYVELQKRFNEVGEKARWGYVSNPSGGFLGFWWNGRSGTIDNKNYRLYLQIEECKLVFKLYVKEESNRKEIRNICRKVLFEKAKEKISIKKYGRLGTHMSIAIISTYEEYRKKNIKDILDIDETVKNLRLIMNVLNVTDKEIKSSY